MQIKKILFVCKGNQIRSPMAAAIFKEMVAKDSDMNSTGIEVKSAGILPYTAGRSSTDEAIEVMRENGIDITSHRATLITPELFKWADLVLVMQPDYESVIIESFGNPGEKVHVLTEFVGEEGYIGAPIGMGIEVHRQTANDLKKLLIQLKKKIKDLNKK